MSPPVCLLIHAAPEAVPAYESALGLPVVRVYCGGYSSAYDGRKGLAAAHGTPDSLLERYGSGCDTGAKIVLVAFSAGCWAVRHWLRDPAWRERVQAAVLVDGYHASGTDQRADITSDSHSGIIAFALDAMAGRRVLCLTHSQIVPLGYASTRATATALLERVGVYRASRHQGAHRGGLHVLAGPGNDEPAHSAQLMRFGPEACRDYVAPFVHGPEAGQVTDPAPPPLLRGVDVSHHQHPGSIDWEALSADHQFVICRATYGTRLDSRVVQHAQRVRHHALTLGLYAFFRPNQDPNEQFRAFRSIAKTVQYGPGDLLPCLDLEDDTAARPIQPDWCPNARSLAEQLRAEFGGCIIYCTQRDWHRLGNPDWLLQYPLWVAHWRTKKPATPNGMPWRLWQHSVKPLPGISNAPIDQNYAHSPLPLQRGSSYLDLLDQQRAEAMIAHTLDQTYRGDS